MMDIIDAIRTILAEKFDTLPVYITQSQQFLRPSFYVYSNLDNRVKANKLLNEINVTINIMYFPPIDDYGNPDIESGLYTYEQLNNLFLGGKLKVKDRYLTIAKTSGGNYQKEILYSLTIDYFDDSPQVVDINAPYELMEHVNINYDNQGGK